MQTRRIANETYLKRYEELCMECEEAKNEYNECRIAAQSPKSQVITGMPFGGGGKKDQADVHVRLEQLHNKYWRLQEQECNMEMRIFEGISKLDDPAEHLVIQMRYLEFKGWKEISQYIGKKLRQTHNIHVKALNNLRL